MLGVVAERLLGHDGVIQKHLVLVFELDQSSFNSRRLAGHLLIGGGPGVRNTPLLHDVLHEGHPVLGPDSSGRCPWTECHPPSSAGIHLHSVLDDRRGSVG